MEYLINTFFNKIFIINLDDRKDRWQQCLDLFKKYNITNYERFSAISPIYKDIPKNYYNNLIVNQTEWYVTGAVGCKLSHYNIIKIAKDRNYDNFLVLEDDFTIEESIDDFHQKMNNVIKLLIEKQNNNINSDEIKNWDMLYLGGNNLDKPIQIYNCIHKALKINTTHAYAMNKSIYQKCLDDMLICGTEVDDFYKTHIQKKHNVLCIYPSLMKQRESVSDIFKGSVMKYNFD